MPRGRPRPETPGQGLGGVEPKADDWRGMLGSSWYKKWGLPSEWQTPRHPETKLTTVGWNAVVHDVVVLCVTLSVRAEAVELSCRAREASGSERRPALSSFPSYPEGKPFGFPMNRGVFL